MNNISLTKKELSTLAGYSYRRLHDIDTALPKEKKLFVKSEANEKKFDLALFVQRWAAYNAGNDMSDPDAEELLEKARHARLKADKLEIEVDRLRGQYVDIGDVERAWMEIVSVAANRLNSMPQKLAPTLVMIADADVIEDMIEREVRDVMNSIADAPLPSEDSAMPDAEDEDEDE